MERYGGVQVKTKKVEAAVQGVLAALQLCNGTNWQQCWFTRKLKAKDFIEIERALFGMGSLTDQWFRPKKISGLTRDQAGKMVEKAAEKLQRLIKAGK